MRKLALVAALSLVAVGAQAQQLELTSLTLTVPFGTITPAGPGGSFGSGVLSGTNVTVNNISWDSITPNATYVFTSNGWSTTVGSGVNVTKTGPESCVGINAALCSDPVRGLVGNYIQGLLQNGSPSAFIAPGTPIATTNVSVTGTGSIGDSVIITRRTEFLDCAVVPAPGPGGGCLSFDGGMTFPLNSSSFTATFAIVPVPAAVWLFASALGIMGWMRRRASVTA